ncbi:MAG: M23 family metallopeptidase [Bacteroidales bacterium]|nr:M23 family metallopeptidase [Bacteroidales bacterium]
MHSISKYLFLSGVFINTALNAQNPVRESARPYNYAAPTDIPMILSGNYGEIRSTHFHAGIDIKTQQIEGKNVLAADDGHIYRIVVQTAGYGKALYLKHANGQVTVYAHLQQFIPSVEKFVRAEQYRRRSYEVDLYPKSDLFPFIKGDLIGLSGNSGNSAGPHLHFEIRDRSSVPLNVLRYGFDIADKIPPRIQWLAVYPLDEQSAVNGSNEKLLLPVSGKNGNHSLAANTVQVSGTIGLGIETYDFLNNSQNECSPNTITLSVDGKVMFSCRFDSIPFSMGPYVNGHIDYDEKKRSGIVIQKLYLEPNNKLGIYKVAINRGFLNFRDTLKHVARITVRDTYGNESVLPFNLQATDRVFQPGEETVDPTVVGTYRYDTLNVFENRDIRVVIPKNALFNHIGFQYAQFTNDSCKWSLVHQVHNEYTPLLKSFILSVKPAHLPVYLQEKALIASPGPKGEWISQGGAYKNGFVTAQVRVFGRFFIAVDTLNPIIIPVSFRAGNRYAQGQALTFKITDNQSGIRKYNGYIDKKWALFEYDAKNDMLSYSIDEARLEKDRSHLLEIIVTDDKDNTASFRGEFFY